MALILAGAALRPASAQTTPLPYEIRCFYYETTAVPPTTSPPSLADITWHRSNLLKEWVDPVSGYSSDKPGTCPNPWNIAGATGTLIDMGAGTATQPGRVISLPEWDMPKLPAPNQSDLMWYNYTAGAAFYRALVGLPFNPQTPIPGAAGTFYAPPDRRGYGAQIYLRAAIPQAGMDFNGDGGTTDITAHANFRFVGIAPAWPAAPVPTDATAVTWTTSATGAPWSPGVATPWVSDVVQPDAHGIITYVSATNPVPPLPAGAYGLGRIYLEWQNPADVATNTWRLDQTPAAATVEPMSTAFFCSRLQMPTTGDTWRNGGGEGTTGPVEIGGGEQAGGSYLARVLVGPATGTYRDDLYMPGATTVRRYFAVINRDDPGATGRTTLLEHLELTPLQALETAPGMSAAGTPRPSLRPTLPDPALIMGPSTIGGGSVSATDIDTGHWLQAHIPSYQPASEPGANLAHTPTNNWGYRGLALLYSDEGAVPATPVSNGQWDFSLSANLDQTTDYVEEFAPLDAQLSVDRQTRLAADTSAAEPGRVAPGTPWQSPDTTVGDPTSYGRFAYPSNVSRTDSLTVSNEGNVSAPVTPVGTNMSLAEPVGVSGKSRSAGRLLAANPVYLPAALYSPLYNTTLPAGTSGAAGGWGTGGLSGMGSTTYPVPLGQGSGQYSSGVVYFQDLGLTPGRLAFLDHLTGLPSNTGVTLFDPLLDVPLEPVTYVPTALRVTESRLPYNDFYAADTEPTLRFDYDANHNVTDAQMMWVSNRYSSAGGGAVDQATPAGSTSPAQAAQVGYPGNILYADVAAPPAGADYRLYTWSSADAKNLTDTTTAYSVNSSPESFTDFTSGKIWTLWHQSLRVGAGFRSTLQYEDPNGNAVALPTTGLPQQGLRGFADPGGQGLWLFWTEGEQGHQTLHYRWDFDPSKPLVAANEAPVPLTNAVTPAWRSDIINDFAGGQPMRKPSTGPFVYTKDPAAFLWTDPQGKVGTQVHVVFSGYTARQQNENICWAAFDQNNMNDPTKNYGKLTFPRVAGEQFTGDGLRQVFGSQHLDWLISSTFETAPTASDPQLYLGLTFSTAPATPALYSINLGTGTYSRSRGLYTFTPTLTQISGPATSWSGVLNNPMATGSTIPLTLQVEPSTGTVACSGALFNTANPSDLGAVLNRTVTGLGNLTNVALFANYTPFLFRVTNAAAADDSPNAFLETEPNDPGLTTDANQLRLVFLWRRSYTAKDAPSFGRTAFMYKTWTLGTQVAYPPLNGPPTVADLTAGAGLTANTDYTYNSTSGIVTMTADAYAGRGSAAATGVFWLQSALDGHVVQISYKDSNNLGHVENQRVLGWSQDTPAPLDTVQNEGPLRAVPEIYTTSTGVPAVRYWLIWSSPRAIYDLRLANNNGSLFHQSSDIYLGTLVPRYGDALREAELDWQNVQE
jgi:hypothetical protein